ncbi:hypothetical protein jhhlp_008255 [Lomentospora prolificans]|uniref:Uncharacterized protein n=1 Tax=Lomentospora prolificans TaxID=41688 RepID=A0A2N3MXI3_9PEZI|nr:hypothetical protein jhhlp_008255 [Lomentospora prolificans]
MEAVAAFGLAVNAMQLLDYTAKSIAVVTQKLSAEEDLILAQICGSSLALARELLELSHGYCKGAAGVSGKLRLVLDAFRTLKLEKKVVRLQGRMMTKRLLFQVWLQWNQYEGADRFADDDFMQSPTLAWQAIFLGKRSPEVSESLGQLFPVDDEDDWEFSPLHTSVLGLVKYTVRDILQLGNPLDVNRRDSYGRTPLHWTAFRGDATAVELLLDTGADVDEQDFQKTTPLQLASESGVARMSLSCRGELTQISQMHEGNLC